MVLTSRNEELGADAVKVVAADPQTKSVYKSTGSGLMTCYCTSVHFLMKLMQFISVMMSKNRNCHISNHIHMVHVLTVRLSYTVKETGTVYTIFYFRPTVQRNRDSVYDIDFVLLLKNYARIWSC